MADVPLKAAPFGGMDPASLAAAFTRVGQPALATPDGALLSPRGLSGSGWLKYKELAQSEFDPAAFTTAFVAIDSRVDPSAQFDLGRRLEAKDSVRRWLDQGDLGQIAHKFQILTPDQRHLWLRDIVLPVFFERYPAGRLACVTYDAVANRYLAHLNSLKRSQILNSSDPAELAKYIGKASMSSFALNVPAEMIWLMLSFVSVIFFPEVFAFVASCEHRYFLVFITDSPISLSQGEERHPPIARLVPTLLSMLDDKPDRSPLSADHRFVPPARIHPFNRRNYSASATAEFLETYVRNLDGLLQWMCEATNFVASDGQFDLDFALEMYLTVYLLLNTTFRIVTEQTDMFTRKMAFFDVLELYAGLVDCSTVSAQATAWKMHLRGDFIANVLVSLQQHYPEPFAGDFVVATNDLRQENDSIVEAGLLYGRNSDGTVTVPNKGNLSFDEFIVSLLRALRNTKHGFAIKDEDYLAIHSGAFANDFPDYVISLWLNLVANRDVYTLKH